MWNIKKADNNAAIPAPFGEGSQVDEMTEPVVVVNGPNGVNHEEISVPKIAVENGHDASDVSDPQEERETAPVKSIGRPIRITRSKTGGK